MPDEKYRGQFRSSWLCPNCKNSEIPAVFCATNALAQWSVSRFDRLTVIVPGSRQKNQTDWPMVSGTAPCLTGQTSSITWPATWSRSVLGVRTRWTAPTLDTAGTAD